MNIIPSKHNHFLSSNRYIHAFQEINTTMKKKQNLHEFKWDTNFVRLPFQIVQNGSRRSRKKLKTRKNVIIIFMLQLTSIPYLNYDKKNTRIMVMSQMTLWMKLIQFRWVCVYSHEGNLDKKRNRDVIWILAILKQQQ